MSWLAGETKWWLILAALTGFVLTMLFQLVRVKVRDSKAVSGSGSLGGSLGGKVAAGAGAAGAGTLAAGAAVKDKIGLDKPDFDKPDLDTPSWDKPAADVTEPDAFRAKSTGPEHSFSGTLPTQAGDPEPDARTVMREPGARTVAPPAGRFGAGSVDANGDGTSPPAGYAIKGNADSMKFHTTDSPYYGRTRAEVWFDSEESARRAGFHRWDEKGPSAGSHRSGV